MQQLIKIINAIAMGLVLALGRVAQAEEPRGFYTVAGAGLSEPAALHEPSVIATELSQTAFGGFRFNSQFGLEGFYADLDPKLLPSDCSCNLYTRSYLGPGLTSDASSTVAGVSAIAVFTDRGPIRPFARAGLHYYDLEYGAHNTTRGDSLLLGAGADIELSRGWNARVEWERYSDIDKLDRNVFSARVEYQF